MYQHYAEIVIFFRSFAVVYAVFCGKLMSYPQKMCTNEQKCA